MIFVFEIQKVYFYLSTARKTFERKCTYKRNALKWQTKTIIEFSDNNLTVTNVI